MTEVESMLKDNLGECGCGCGAFGTLKKPWRSNGVRCVQRRCKCAQCRGKNNGRNGDKRAREAKRALGITGPNSRHEEHQGGLVRWEAKSGAQVRPMWTAFMKAEAQSELARPFGDNRPFVMTAVADGEGEQLVAFRLSKLDEVLMALAEQRGLVA